MRAYSCTCRGTLACAGLAALIALTAGSAGSANAAEKKANRKPNFIVIFTDDQGYGDLSCFGATHVHTPVIDRLAAEGAKLTSLYAAPLCTPSRAALLTGCYPKRIGMATGSTFGVLLAGDTKGLNPVEVTIAEVLKDAGYATGIFGKWHLGDQPEFLPTRQGFDEFFGIPYSHDIHPTHPQQQRFHFPPLPLLEGEKVIEVNPDADYLTQRFTDHAVAFIEAHRDRPFFLYVPYSMPHRPVHASPPFMKDVASSLQAALRQANPSVDCPRRDDLYPQAIAEIDGAVDRIVQTLRRLQLDRDTLVVFTSDNGPGPSTATAGPLRGRKGSTWEGGLREPAVAWWPGHIPAGMVSDQVLTTMDLLPTFARLAGAAFPANRIIDGKDIWPVLSGQPGATPPHEFFFYHRGDTLDAVRSGRWKCFRSGPLYDLETDIGEKKDVAGEHPEVVTRLRQAMDAFEADIKKNARPAGRVDNARPLGLKERSIGQEGTESK